MDNDDNKKYKIISQDNVDLKQRLADMEHENENLKQDKLCLKRKIEMQEKANCELREQNTNLEIELQDHRQRHEQVSIYIFRT